MQSHKSAEPDIPKLIFSKAPYLTILYMKGAELLPIPGDPFVLRDPV